MDDSVRKSISMPMEQNPRWKGRTGRKCVSCGITLFRKTKGDRCQKCRKRTGQNNPFFGKTHDSITRKRMKASQAKRDKATYKGGGGSPEKLSLARKRWWATVSDERKFAMLQGFIAAGQRANKQSAKTKIETIVRELLDQIGMAFEQNKQVGRYNLDFVIEDGKAIECYGDFWHCNPKLFAHDWYNGSLKMTSEEKWAKDAQRIKRLGGLGFETLILWENEIRTNPRQTLEKIKTFLEK